MKICLTYFVVNRILKLVQRIFKWYPLDKESSRATAQTTASRSDTSTHLSRSQTCLYLTSHVWVAAWCGVAVNRSSNPSAALINTIVHFPLAFASCYCFFLPRCLLSAVLHSLALDTTLTRPRLALAPMFDFAVGPPLFLLLLTPILYFCFRRCLDAGGVFETRRDSYRPSGEFRTWAAL